MHRANAFVLMAGLLAPAACDRLEESSRSEVAGQSHEDGDHDSLAIGGIGSAPSELPGIVYLGLTVGEKYFECTGSVVDGMTVLTAAHCADAFIANATGETKPESFAINWTNPPSTFAYATWTPTRSYPPLIRSTSPRRCVDWSDQSGIDYIARIAFLRVGTSMLAGDGLALITFRKGLGSGAVKFSQLTGIPARFENSIRVFDGSPLVIVGYSRNKPGEQSGLPEGFENERCQQRSGAARLNAFSGAKAHSAAMFDRRYVANSKEGVSYPGDSGGPAILQEDGAQAGVNSANQPTPQYLNQYYFNLGQSSDQRLFLRHVGGVASLTQPDRMLTLTIGNHKEPLPSPPIPYGRLDRIVPPGPTSSVTKDEFKDESHVVISYGVRGYKAGRYTKYCTKFLEGTLLTGGGERESLGCDISAEIDPGFEVSQRFARNESVTLTAIPESEAKARAIACPEQNSFLSYERVTFDKWTTAGYSGIGPDVPLLDAFRDTAKCPCSGGASCVVPANAPSHYILCQAVFKFERVACPGA